MKDADSVVRRTVAAVLVVALAALLGCAGRKAGVRTAQGVMLRYKAPKGTELTYEKTEKSTQSMKMMGQSIDTSTQGDMVFKVESKGTTDGNLSLVITIVSGEAGLQTPQGDFTADMQGVVGKSFDMVLSPLGVESSLAGADSIQYSMGLAGMRSIKPDFGTFFPDLPENRVNILDTWASSDSLLMQQGGMDVTVLSSRLNVLDGYETVDGRECAKITAEIDGTLSGSGMQGGANLKFEGDLTGEDVWYFDYEDGFYVKSSTSMAVTATVTVTGAQEMTIPLTQTITSTANLVE
jgi:hypothetical protein